MKTVALVQIGSLERQWKNTSILCGWISNVNWSEIH